HALPFRDLAERGLVEESALLLQRVHRAKETHSTRLHQGARRGKGRRCERRRARSRVRAVKMRGGNAVVELVEGDITALAVDTIVNPANAALQLGGGVA